MWLNSPIEIIEDNRIVVERQKYIFLLESVVTTRERTRKTTWTRSRWVGADYDGAVEKAGMLALLPGVEEAEVIRAGEGGQYHVICTRLTEGTWSDWA